MKDIQPAVYSVGKDKIVFKIHWNLLSAFSLPSKKVHMYVRTMYKIVTYVCTTVIVISFRVYSLLLFISLTF